MKQVQLSLVAYRPEKYEADLLEYDYWRREINVFTGFKDEHHRKLHLGEFANRSIVKPCLVSNDDRIEIGDKVYHTLTMDIVECKEFWKSEEFNEDDIFTDR